MFVRRFMGSCFLMGLGLLCCTSPEPIEPDLGLDYFPLKVGTYIVYEVDEIQYNQVTGDIQSAYELKVTVTDSAANPEGGFTYTLLRQKRTDAATPWYNLDTWTARVSGREFIMTEGNQPFVKLVFPPSVGISWDGNAYNTLGGEEQCGTLPCDSYQLLTLDEPFELPDTTFAHTLTIIQNDNPDRIVKKDIRKEVYALHVGLIYHEATVLNYCTNVDCLGQEIVETGFQYIQSIKEYGR